MTPSTVPYPGFNVGPVRVDPPLVLAPMESVTNLAFRLIAKRIANPGLMFSEFVSAQAIRHGAVKTLGKMRVLDEERPLAVQVFGADPEVVAETARIAEEMGADIVDVNMGCWVPKVVKTGSGAALMKDPDLAERIVKAVVKAVRIPVSVKVRAGWDYALFAAPELAKRFEAAGAAMISLHARFAKQGLSGEADWQLIRDLRKAVSVPLVGNGDVHTPEDARRMMDDTGCDAVMVGRAAIANPWALARIRTGLTGEPLPPEPTIADRVGVALEHVRLMAEFHTDLKGEVDHSPDGQARAVRALRGQLPLYVKGVAGAPRFRARLSLCSSLDDVRRTLEDVLASSGS